MGVDPAKSLDEGQQVLVAGCPGFVFHNNTKKKVGDGEIWSHEGGILEIKLHANSFLNTKVLVYDAQTTGG